MISLAETRRIASDRKTDPSVIERDYVLGWFLSGLFRHGPLSESLVLKGGTALRKLYFPDYRFSEDLDFTLTQSISEDRFRRHLLETCQTLTQETGIEFVLAALGKTRDEEGSEAYEGKVQYVGPRQHRSGTPPRFKLDMTLYEILVLKPVSLPLIHPYSDKCEAIIPTYCLEEILAEKLRALLTRTRARDLYDVWNLLKHHRDKIQIQQVVSTFHRKRQYKSVPFKNWVNSLTPSRLVDFERAWEASLARQLRDLPKFGQVRGDLEPMLKQLFSRTSED